MAAAQTLSELRSEAYRAGYEQRFFYFQQGKTEQEVLALRYAYNSGRLVRKRDDENRQHPARERHANDNRT